MLVAEPGDGAVVHDAPGVGLEDAVADAPDLQVGEAVRVEALEERRRVGPAHDQLPESGDVDQADRVVDVLCLGGGIAVRVGAPPGARPHHPRAELLVAVVDGRPLCRLVRAPGEQAERHRLPGRARRRRPDGRLVGLVLAGVEADGGEVAELPLARPHRHGRVALGELDRVEALGDGALDVLVRDVLADAHEALALARGPVVGGRRNGAGDPFTRCGADGLHSLGQLGGDEDSAWRVVVDAGAGLREEGVRRLAPAGHDEEVARNRPLVELDGRDPAFLPSRRNLADTGLTEVDDGGDLRSHLLEEGDHVEAGLVSAHDHGPVTRLQRPEADEPSHRLGQDDADEVVPGKEERLLECARGHDDVLGAEAIEDVARVDRDEVPLVDPEGGRGRDDLDARELASDEVRALVDQHDLAALGGVALRRLHARVATADDEHVGPPVLRVEAGPSPGVLVHLAEAGDAAEELFVHRPCASRPDHRPVVEADRRERPADRVGDPQRRPG